MLPFGAGSSFITCGGIELANFTTATGLRDTMTPILAVLCCSSLVAGQAVGIPQSIWSYRVKSHGKWEVVDDDDVVLMPDNVIRCRFNLNHELFPSGFYDVRWFRTDDRGKFVEITRERFQLRDHSVGRRTGSASRTPSKVGYQTSTHRRG
jgi:hypothetical protein